MKFLNSKGFLHFVISLAILPFQQTLPEVIKLAFAPYIFYLVFKKNPIFIPALLAYVTPGTTISFSVLVSTFILTLASTLDLKNNYGLGKVLLFTFVPLPILLYLTYVRVFELNVGFVGMLIPFDLYLGLFPFFYGVLCYNKFDYVSLKAIIFALFILPLLNTFQLIDFSVRIFWLSYPVFFTIFLGSVLHFIKNIRIDRSVFFLSTLFLVIHTSPKFTLLFSGIVGFLIIYLKTFNKQFILNIISTWKLIALFTAFVALIIYSSNSDAESVGSQHVSWDERSYYESWESFKSKLYFKSFKDRAPIWAGALEMLKKEDEYYFFPPAEPLNYELKSLSGSIVESDGLAVHNLPLELMRHYGVFFGLTMTLCFFIYLVMGPGKFISKLTKDDKVLNFMAAGTIGSAFVGSLVGQYPLMSTFSVSMISLFGIYYGMNFKNKS